VVTELVTELELVHEERWVRGQWGGTEIFRYVHQPWDAQLESPRPYFHPLRTLRGDLVTVYRPWDHIWHKGMAWSLPNVGPENFWGGVTWVRDQGYVQLPNDGAMRHDAFETDGANAVTERLSWVTERGETWVTERRRVAAAVWPDAGAWTLSFETTMRNVSGAEIRIGSPTTEGRENAGYGGLFWRGPRSFTGGRVVTPDAEGGDELMGRRGRWLGFVGRHDEHDRASTLVFRDAPENQGSPTKWFVRSTPFGCVCPAPFFDEVYPLADGAEVSFRYDVAIADGDLDVAGCAALAARMAKEDAL
jgi:hypothetical protein